MLTERVSKTDVLEGEQEIIFQPFHPPGVAVPFKKNKNRVIGFSKPLIALHN